MQAYLYALELQGGYIYVGITRNLVQRLRAHLRGSGALVTRLRPPRILLAVEVHPDWAAAARAERRLKDLPRNAKLVALKEIGIARIQAVDEAIEKLATVRSAQSPNSAVRP